jgi:hypothetical protein
VSEPAVKRTEQTWTHAQVLRYAAELVDLFAAYVDNGDTVERAKLKALSELDGALEYDASLAEVRQ